MMKEIWNKRSFESLHKQKCIGVDSVTTRLGQVETKRISYVYAEEARRMQ